VYRRPDGAVSFPIDRAAFDDVEPLFRQRMENLSFTMRHKKWSSRLIIGAGSPKGYRLPTTGVSVKMQRSRGEGEGPILPRLISTMRKAILTCYESWVS
jgi:hypothetical protein